MISMWQLKIAPAAQRRDVLGNEYFAGAMLAAFLLHIFAYFIWYLSPKPQVIDIPVRALSLKLGDDDAPVEVSVKLLAPSPTNHTKVENVLSKLVRSQEKEAARATSVVNSMDKAMDVGKAKPAKPQKLYKFDVRSEGVKSAAPVMEVAERQFVRDVQPTTLPSAESKAPGNTTSKEAEMIARYEQLISMWIQKFKIYPEAAKQAGQMGETVARVRIDRRGNIRYYTLERSTGHTALDQAAIDMIKRANPVPAVPQDYPPGDLLEFRIPIRFNVK